MKKLIYLAFATLIAVNFSACKEEETTVYDAPSFTVTAANSTVKVGNATEVTVNVSKADGKVASISASVVGGGSIGNFSTDPVGLTSGTSTATFTAGNTAGTAVITVEVTDYQDPARSTTETLSIIVTELDPPTISLSEPSATVDPGVEAAVDVAVGAEAGLNKWTVTLMGEEVFSQSLSGTSANGSYAYTPTGRDMGALEFTIEVEDVNSTKNSTIWTVNVNASTPDARWALSFVGDENSAEDPAFAANSIVPSSTGPANGSAIVVENDFLEAVDYKGAVDPDAATPWYLTDTWSFYAHILTNGGADKPRAQGANTITVTDGDLNGNGTPDGDESLTEIEWTKDNTYLLEGFVFVEDGQTLTIGAGTVIKGKPGAAESASALVIARGGMIMANGTSAEPIIMTYEADPLDGSIAPSTRGQWGGLIILGRAGLNSANGTTQIEGIPTSEPRGLYGGNTDDDSSGELHYVSIRHGGTDIGAGNEINGLTLGGVGSETVIDNVEIVGNNDDGIEWFGGTVNGTHLIVAFQGDDGLDFDEGYRGTNQFVIVHQDPTPAGDRGGEHDGGTSPETGTPYAIPTFANVTSVGSGAGNSSRVITFRDNAGGYYVNSIFTGYRFGIDVEDLPADEQDSYKQFLDGNLGVMGCMFHDIGTPALTTASELFTITN